MEADVWIEVRDDEYEEGIHGIGVALIPR